MRSFFSILAALTLALAATSAAFADDNLDPPDTLQQNQGPGNMDATTKALKKHPVPTPSPVPAPKMPARHPASSGY